MKRHLCEPFYKIADCIDGIYSDYRSTFMGIAILNVLTIHFFLFSDFSHTSFLLDCLYKSGSLVYVEGFLFLSGYGSYFSYSKNRNVRNFYKRRFLRIMVPYVLATTPFFVFQDLLLMNDGVTFLKHFSTIGYWIDGNYNAMWYIAITILLYLISPFVFQAFLHSNGGINSFLTLLLFLIIAIILNCILDTYFHEWYLYHILGLNQYFVFFVGVYCAHYVKSSKNYMMLSLLVLFFITYFVQTCNPHLCYFYVPFKKIVFYMPILGLLFTVFRSVAVVSILRKCFDWLGLYTLEIYLLHSVYYSFLEILKIPFITSCTGIVFAIVLSFVTCMPLKKLSVKVMEKF